VLDKNRADVPLGHFAFGQSYLENPQAVVEELPRIVSEPKKDAHESFRRICFNALISNLDDHPCNHALMAREQHWALSPAYDLTPSPVVGEERAISRWRPAIRAVLPMQRTFFPQHVRFLLEKKEEAEKDGRRRARRRMRKPEVQISPTSASSFQGQHRSRKNLLFHIFAQLATFRSPVNFFC
jgi:hypothetical protein